MRECFGLILMPVLVAIWWGITGEYFDLWKIFMLQAMISIAFSLKEKNDGRND